MCWFTAYRCLRKKLEKNATKHIYILLWDANVTSFCLGQVCLIKNLFLCIFISFVALSSQLFFVCWQRCNNAYLDLAQSSCTHTTLHKKGFFINCQDYEKMPPNFQFDGYCYCFFYKAIKFANHERKHTNYQVPITLPEITLCFISCWALFHKCQCERDICMLKFPPSWHTVHTTRTGQHDVYCN